ncbi:MAG TPA: AAA-like domain-containing protein [Candidatus Kapabacteria bacterium]|nr:AAA-like domain-containing protein [Candidatus Kapabacteria bacterium]
MKRIFNTTGTCIPTRHFMADVSGKVDRVMEMIDNGFYFTINRPRQYGKTTMMYLLFQRMQKNKDYLPIDISFEGIGASTYASASRFIPAVLDLLSMRLEFMEEKEAVSLLEKNSNIHDFGKLSRFFTEFVRESGRKVVLMIDEVDKSSNNQLFLDFLGMLRTKYLGRNEGKDYSFHSVILAGVHDIKTLKAKMRRDSEQKYNSPWNIAVDFEVDLALLPNEISAMLEEYSKERKVKMDISFFTEYLFYFTSGYPFLVSLLCKIIDEKILPTKKKKEWNPDDLVKAVQIALKNDNTNFDSLVKNLENNPELYELAFNIIMNEKEYSYNRLNALIHQGTIYGILKEEKGKTRVHNRLYEQIIYDYMSSNLETSGGIKNSAISASYIREDGTLDIKKIIQKFQEFIKEQYSTKDTPFIERNGRLLFLAFIKPIINGKGFDFKEVEVSEEKRLDIVITFENQKYIIELKIWRGEVYHQEGIRQLCDYLDRQNQSKGYLLIYDLRKETGKVGEWEKIEEHGKEIYAAWV